MTSLLFSLYLILVAVWLIFSVIVVVFALRHHFFSVTNWVMIGLYAIISLQIFTVTASSLKKYTQSSTLLPFAKERTYEYHLTK